MSDFLDARRLAEALRTVDVIEKRPVDSYVPLAMEIAAAYGPMSVPDVLAGVPQREPVGAVLGQGAVTDVGPHERLSYNPDFCTCGESWPCRLAAHPGDDQ